jgi:hypothetical protein
MTTIDWERVLAVLLLGFGTWFVLGLPVALAVGFWVKRGRGR